MKTLNTISTLINHRSIKLAALGVVAFAAQTACSGEPVKSNNGPSFPTAGTSAGGTPAAGGSGISGSFGTSGTGFGTAGTEVGGTGGGTAGTDAGGTGGAAAGTAGTAGGPPVVVVPPFCQGKTPTALPFDVQTAFYESAWQGDFSQITIPADLAVDACTTRAQGAVGHCSKWRYTPAALGATWAAVAWVNRADANFTHEPVCLATGATRISFLARGVKGGEVVSFGGGSANEVAITLTTEWQEFEVPLEGVTYTTPDGVSPNGFSWKVDPAVPAEDTVITEFFIDSVQFVTTPLVGNGGGEGGSGAGGDSGVGGAG